MFEEKTRKPSVKSRIRTLDEKGYTLPPNNDRKGVQWPARAEIDWRLMTAFVVYVVSSKYDHLTSTVSFVLCMSGLWATTKHVFAVYICKAADRTTQMCSTILHFEKNHYCVYSETLLTPGIAATCRCARAATRAFHQ